jgi:hypothetical protein
MLYYNIMAVNGLIYKITSSNTEMVYVGSTKNRLCLRKTLHKYHYKLYLDNKFKYLKSFDIIQYNDWKIEKLEELICEDIKQLRQREAHYIKTLENCINRNIPCRTHQEYRNDNRDKLNEKARIRYKNKNS